MCLQSKGTENRNGMEWNAVDVFSNQVVSSMQLVYDALASESFLYFQGRSFIIHFLFLLLYIKGNDR